jgi:hypothetical protein
MLKKKTNKWSLKKIVYILLSVALGKLLGFIAFGMLSIKFAKILVQRGLPVENDQIFWLVWSPLPDYLYWTLIWAGAIGGFFLGLKWWRIVYVEHRHWRRQRKG